MKNTDQRIAAKAFAEYWKDRGYEKGESQPFWLSLLHDVYDVEHPEQFIQFEEQVQLDHTSFIDGSIPSTHVLIEQKGRNKDLRKPIKQSDGTLLSPFDQAKRYSGALPYSKRPRWIVACNFKEFLVYDMEKPTGEPESILLEDLPKEYYRLQFLVNKDDDNIKKEMEISIKAGNLVGVLYDEILKQYIDPENEETLKSLNQLCVRLVFCLYAEDAGIFGGHNKFHDYIKAYPAEELRDALIRLFKILDTKVEDRDKYLNERLAVFPYVNGGLFADGEIEIPQLNDKIKDLLLKNASEEFDWSDISPTIFGAVFESTLNPETRRSGGMHYTSIENIHKVIDPLFLDELREKLDTIKEIKVEKTRLKALEQYREKLSKLTFLDPACGSGNFLTETYISLRKLENEALKVATNQITMDTDIINVSIGQFYGIEINDFAVTVAKTALWIAESQMMKETEEIVNQNIEFLPLKSYANIVEGNALRIDWETVVPKHELDYIMGNPPFVGARMMSDDQKQDVLRLFDGVKNNGNLDYVACWYKKAASMMLNSSIHTALVSTNSITQGEQVAILWKNLFSEGIHIDFAHRTFRWDSEANIKAHVHCIIVGFSYMNNRKERAIYDSDQKRLVKNINGYLLDAENVFIENRNKPLSSVPEIKMGNQPIDDGQYLFDENEMLEFVKKEPDSQRWFREWYGAQEFINQKPRYCLWLGECSPKELRQMPLCLERVDMVRKSRLASKRASTLKLADTPTRFQTENMPTDNYIVIPEVSSEKRKYIPIGFMNPAVLCSNKLRLMPSATMYHFGVLTSNVHMAWMRAVAGRLEMRYDYSIKIVYNNFPWPTPTVEQQTKIEKTAQAILDARALYPDCSLADLYDEVTMPPELRKAHQENDRAVMKAYGFDIKTTTESSCVAELMKMYQELAKQ